MNKSFGFFLYLYVLLHKNFLLMNLINSPILKLHTAFRSLALPSIRSRVSALPPPSPPLRSMNSSAVSKMASTSLNSDDFLVQYVVLRRDLIDEWPLGSTVTQACHAAIAAIWIHRDRIDTAAYLSASNLDSMTKVCSMNYLPLCSQEQCRSPILVNYRNHSLY